MIGYTEDFTDMAASGVSNPLDIIKVGGLLLKLSHSRQGLKTPIIESCRSDNNCVHKVCHTSERNAPVILTSTL